MNSKNDRLTVQTLVHNWSCLLSKVECDIITVNVQKEVFRKIQHLFTKEILSTSVIKGNSLIFQRSQQKPIASI